jgi:hypothetical protein
MKSSAKTVSAGPVRETRVHPLSQLKGPLWGMAICRVNFNRIFESLRDFSLSQGNFPLLSTCRLTALQVSL